jgi:hypothetical protein
MCTSVFESNCEKNDGWVCFRLGALSNDRFAASSQKKDQPQPLFEAARLISVVAFVGVLRSAPDAHLSYVRILLS